MKTWQGAIDWCRARPLWLRVAAPSALGLVVFSWTLIPVVVRRAVTSRCEERQLRCEIGSVRLGLGRLWLLDVNVVDTKLPLARASAGSVQVRPMFFGPAGVRVFGVRAEVTASKQALQERLHELSSRGGNAALSASPAESHRPFEVSGLDVALREPGRGRRLNAWGVRLARSENGWLGAADLVEVGEGQIQTRVRAAEVSVSNAPQGARRVERLDVASASLKVELPEGQESDERAASTPPEPSQAGAGPAFGWAAVRSVVGEVTSASFRANVVALTIEAQRGRESLRFGPSRFSALREGETLALDLVPLPVGGRAEATPLSMRVRLPLGDARPELDLTGGPVSLSALGVREGDLGLVFVHDARLEATLHASVAPDLSTVELSSHGLLENVRVRRPALGPNELRGIRLGWQVEGNFARGQKLEIKQAELSLGDVRLRLAGEASRIDARTSVSLRAEVPQVACGALLAAVPSGMAPLLDGVRAEGTLSLKGSIEFDSAHLDTTRVNLDVRNQCRIVNVPPAISPNRFRNGWSREVKGPDGLPMMIQSGPGSPDWTAYEEISPFLETAVVVCEDAGFFSHRGIDYRAIENSIRMNFEAGRFLRGGSTVTMQLAKNLYLGKEKTLSRKFQEAVFTVLLEQELSKHELLELYLNVIEFGPGIYGIRQAARYYFNEEPRDLSLGQALYLASILPAPDTQHFAPDGRVKERWMQYLQKLMRIARKIGRISEEELTAGLADQVAFRKPSVSGSALGATDDAVDDADDPPEP